MCRFFREVGESAYTLGKEHANPTLGNRENADHPLARMARVCKEFGYTPAQYYKITLREIEWLEQYNHGIAEGYREKHQNK